MKKITLQSRISINEEAIRSFLEGLGYSETKLAEEMNCSRAYVHRVLKGERNVGLSFVQGLTKLGMKAESIFLS